MKQVKHYKYETENLVCKVSDKKGLGKKLARKKVWIAKKIELFSPFFFGSYGSRGATTMADH